MNDQMKHFIEDNIELIENSRWSQLYNKIEGVEIPSMLTEILWEVDIYPEYELDYIPFQFLAKSDIKEFIIPSNIKTIELWAFYACRQLTSIVIPDSVIEIGNSAFLGCKNLMQVAIGKNVDQIGDSAFKNCASLTDMIIPEKVTVIPHALFSGCKNLQNVQISNNITEIDSYAFGDCGNNLIIKYSGTLNDWRKINIAENAFQNTQVLVNYIDNK